MTNDEIPMAGESAYRRLLHGSLLAVVVALLAVVFCYYLVDRPVAFYVHNHHWSDVYLFKWLTLPPPIVQSWSPAVLALLMLRRGAWGPLTHCQWALFVACLCLIVADEFRTSMAQVAGRYWPETWINDNPSLIGTGKYGFHPFESDDDIGSFPSGHAARICGFLGVWWLALPRLRALYAIVALPMLFSLVAMDYHFVGDVIAGSILGGIVAAWGVMLAGVNAKEPPRHEGHQCRRKRGTLISAN